MGEPLILSRLRHWLAERDTPPASGPSSTAFIELADVRKLLAWIDAIQSSPEVQP